MSGSLEVNPEQSIALIEVSVGSRLKLECSQKFRNWSLEVQDDVGMTRGPVENENNNQSQDLNILNIIFNFYNFFIIHAYCLLGQSPMSDITYIALITSISVYHSNRPPHKLCNLS